MHKKLFFLSGMPRSGSTLLGQLLCQHPDIHVSGTSGILSMIVNVRNHWSKIDEFRALDPKVSEQRKVNTMRSMLNGFYADIERPVIIDKSRAWPAHLELAEALLSEKPKCIVTVRDARDVLASFERKYREAKADTLVAQEEGNQIEYQTCAGRCRVLASANQIVGQPVLAIRDAVSRGWRKQMLFVEYDKLCADPKKTLMNIYDFLGISPCGTHDTQNVQSAVVERDEVYQYKNLHQIRATVAPQEPQWPIYLPKDVADQYKLDARFWETF